MVEIKELKPTKRNLLKFVHFPIDDLYADNPYYVPALVTDEVDTLDPTKNPASCGQDRSLRYPTRPCHRTKQEPSSNPARRGHH